jgi:hypothetical protein
MRVSLGLLRDHISFLLIEGRIDDVREKFPDMEEETFDSIVANQPAGSNNKYLMWAAKQVDDGTMPEEVIMAIRLFHDNQQRLKQKDINQYKDVDELNTAIDELSKNKSKSQGAKQAKADTQVIYNDDRWLVVRPFTQEASCKYGAGSKWCISATASRNYFASYSTNNNKFYFVIDKKATGNAPDSKFAIAIIATGIAAAGREIQVYDAADKLVGVNVVAKHVGDKWPQIWELIQAHVKANPQTREVEEAQKATEEHVKALLNGEKLSDVAIKKVAAVGKLTNQIITAILKQYEDYSGPTDYRDTRGDIMNTLSSRAAEMPPEAAVAVMKWISSTRTASGYWSGNYYLERMLTNANLGPQNFRDLAENSDEAVLANIYTNPNAPDDLKEKIAATVMKFKTDDAKRKVYWELIKSGKITAKQMKDAMTTGPSTYNSVQSTLLSSPTEVNLAPELIRMIPVETSHQFEKLLQIPNVPSDYVATVLTALMKSGSIEKYDLYQILKTIPLETDHIETLWKDNKNQDSRVSLLQNPSIGPNNASTFARSKNSAYRFAVAHNTVTLPDDLSLLANDESVSTRSAVAANPKTPADTLLKLAKDEAIAVRASVASNANAGQNVLQALKRDSDEFTRKIARKTLKSLGTTEALIRFMMGMGGPLLEAMSDDETPDTMSPSWRALPTGRGSVMPEEFIAVFLLQNNGHATREEISNAFQDWQGTAGHGELWKKPWSNDKILRGITAGGKGWYWSPPGVNKGALFRLTPAGASAALLILKKYTNYGAGVKTDITSATARPGETYYTVILQPALDITGYGDGDLTIEEVEAGYDGKAVKRDGKYTKLNPNRSRYAHRRGRSVKLYKYTSPTGEVKHVETFPTVQLPRNSEVQYIKAFYGLPMQNDSWREKNQAIVKHGDKTLLVPFPLWAASGGESIATKKDVPPPVRKSPPPRELTGEPAPAREPRETGPRGPKISYKVYGKMKGAPAHTRLKGKAYVAPANTQFAPGEQATIQTADGKLKVKKVGSDHEQTWEPTEG